MRLCKCVYQTWAELAGRGAILHSSWLPGIAATVSEDGEAASSWSSLPSCKQKALMCTWSYSILLIKYGAHYCCLQRSQSLTNWCKSIKQFILLCCFFSLLSLSCHFSCVVRRRQSRRRADTLSTSHRAHTASFCCGKKHHPKYRHPQAHALDNDFNHLALASEIYTEKLPAKGSKKHQTNPFDGCSTNW